MASEPLPAIFLDRDGTVVEDTHYLSRPEDVRLIAGAAGAIRRLRDAGFVVVFVTNQSGIARGLYSEADYRAVQARVEALLSAEGASIGGSYHCPHHPLHTGPCACRKPAPGLYQAASSDLGLAPGRSWFIGDKRTDVAPAHHFGGRGVLVRTGHGEAEAAYVAHDVWVVEDLAEAAALVLAEEGKPPGA